MWRSHRATAVPPPERSVGAEITQSNMEVSRMSSVVPQPGTTAQIQETKSQTTFCIPQAKTVTPQISDRNVEELNISSAVREPQDDVEAHPENNAGKGQPEHQE